MEIHAIHGLIGYHAVSVIAELHEEYTRVMFDYEQLYDVGTTATNHMTVCSEYGEGWVLIKRKI